MNPLKWNFVFAVVLSLISAVVSESVAAGSRQQQQKHHVPMAPTNQSANAPPYWDYILREFVFKTLSPPPSSNINLYKRLLDAPLYGGPFPTGPTDGGSFVLSRGDVYYLPNNNWLLCQEGCVDCKVCSEHTHPVLKWVLRQVKRRPVHGQERQDLQLTLIPRIDGSYLLRSLWPRSHVYVTTPDELEAFQSDRIARQGSGNQSDSLGQQKKASNFLRFVERDSLPERRVLGEQSNDTDPPETDAPGSERTTSDHENARNTISSDVSTRTRVKLPDRPAGNDSIPTPVAENARNRSKLLLPKLILGTDQLGQRHLVHVVPADGTRAGNSTSPGLMAALSTGGVGRIQNRTAYQRILKRIYDSLSNNRKSIESFLDPPSQTDRRQEVYQQQETRNSLSGLQQWNKLHREYKETIRNESQRWPLVLNWSRQRRKFNEKADVKTVINDLSNNSHDLEQNRDNDISLTTSNRSNMVQNSKHGPRMFKVVVTTESTTKSLNKSEAIVNFARDIAMTNDRFNYNSTMKTGEHPMSISLIN